MRRLHVTQSSTVGSSSACPVARAALRWMHLPGWKTRQSTRDQRTREQREVDRKARQIEKLPRPQALHDFQYPYEKTVLADHMFQPPVFENELDTPHLFHIHSPADFILYWNCSDFDRCSYPAVPEEDHRLLIPSDDNLKWVEHRTIAEKYLTKHEICPSLAPHVGFQANLSVCFAGSYRTREACNAETGERLPPNPPPTSLNHRNFWFTSHYGNYMELCELQQEPSIFFTTPSADDDTYYTLIIASPDYPYRTARPQAGSTQRGFFLHYVVANLRGGHSEGRKTGDVVASYIPPLPTEDAGTTRHLCFLFRQLHHVPNLPPPIGGGVQRGSVDSSQATAQTFAGRSNFRLHEDRHSNPLWLGMRDIERALPADPVALTFFQTKWDIQVQEFYESLNLPEPAYRMDSELEAILRYNSLSSADLQVRARHQPDGSTNMGMVPRQLVQWQPTLPKRGSMRNLWSRRTSLGANGVPIVTPH